MATTGTTRTTLPDLVAAVERGEVGAATHGSFHRYSVARGRHVWWSEEAVTLLADELRSLPGTSWEEVGAGDGGLARALAAHGLRVRATDRTARPGVAAAASHDGRCATATTRDSENRSADSAIHQSDVAAPDARRVREGVLSVFPPGEAGFCAALFERSRRVPLLLVTAELDGLVTCGDAIADGGGRRVRRVAALEAELVCKHDFCQVLGDASTLVRHARAWSVVPDAPAGGSAT